MSFEAQGPSQDHACPVYNRTQLKRGRTLIFPECLPSNSLKSPYKFIKKLHSVLRNARCSLHADASRRNHSSEIIKGGFNGFTKQR